MAVNESEFGSDEESEHESSSEEESIDFDSLQSNQMRYFLFPMCPSKCAGKFAKMFHTLMFLFVLVSIVFSITNYTVGPNESMFRSSLPNYVQSEDVKLEADHLLSEYQIIMQSSVYYINDTKISDTYFIDDVITVRNTVGRLCIQK